MKELRTLYRYRLLIATLTARDLKARYRGSILGLFWSVAIPLMAVPTLFLAGIAMTVASAAVLFRDLRDIIMNLMTLGFFLTPILYTIDRIDKRWLRALLRINPMTPFVISYQDVFFFGRLPALSDTFLMVAYAVASVALGMTVFGRLRDTLAEAI